MYIATMYDAHTGRDIPYYYGRSRKKLVARCEDLLEFCEEDGNEMFLWQLVSVDLGSSKALLPELVETIQWEMEKCPENTPGATA